LLILKSTSQNEIKQIGGVHHNHQGDYLDSIAYGYATNNGYTLPHAAGFISPKMVQKLPLQMNNPYTGIIREANEVRSVEKFYYDGTENLGSSIHVNCDVYSTIPNSCVHNSKCGWCGSSNTCIPGNSRGPLASCIRSTFLYTAPSDIWNPFKAGTVNIRAMDRKERSILTIAPNPDLRNVLVKND